MLAILASQNKTLAGPRARRPTRSWRRWRASARHVAGALASSTKVAQATAERRGGLPGRTSRGCPTFLRELRPTMTRLGALSDEMTPVLADLHAAAPDVNRLIDPARPVLAGRAAGGRLARRDAPRSARPAITAARPVIRDLRDLGNAAQPVAQDLAPAARVLPADAAASSARWTTSSTRWPRSTASTRIGHYLRAGLIVNLCSTYSIEPIPAARRTSRAERRLAEREPRTRPSSSLRARPGAARAASRQQARLHEDAARRPEAGRRRAGPRPAREPAGPHARRAGARRHGRATRARAARRADAEADPLLDYLFGRRRMSAARRRHRRQPGADRRRDGARGDRRRLPVLQREHGPAVRPDLHDQGRAAQRGATWSWATTSGSAAARVGAVSEIDAERQRRRHDHRASLDLKLEQGRRAAAGDSTVLVRPRSALGLKYVEITRGERRGRASRTARRSRSPRPRPSRSSSTSSSTCSTSKTRDGLAGNTLEASATRSPAAASRHQHGDRRPPAAAARHRCR